MAKRVICAIDTVPEGTRLIRFASELASGYGAKVCLAHGVPAAEAGPERYFDLEFTASLETQARGKVTAMQWEVGTDFDVCLGAGNVADVVRDAAEKHNADLVVIGRGPLCGAPAVACVFHPARYALPGPECLSKKEL